MISLNLNSFHSPVLDLYPKVKKKIFDQFHKMILQKAVILIPRFLIPYIFNYNYRAETLTQVWS